MHLKVCLSKLLILLKAFEIALRPDLVELRKTERVH
jgi:hypothetical protein